MRKKRIQETEDYGVRHRRRRIWKKVVGGFVCAAALCAACAPIQPALTMEEAKYGVTEHVHTEDCFLAAEGSADESELICEVESHIHTEEYRTAGEPAGKAQTEETQTEGKTQTEETQTEGKAQTEETQTEGKAQTEETQTEGKTQTEETQTGEAQTEETQTGEAQTEGETQTEKAQTEKAQTEKAQTEGETQAGGTQTEAELQTEEAQTGEVQTETELQTEELPTEEIQIQEQTETALADMEQALADEAIVLSVQEETAPIRLFEYAKQNGVSTSLTVCVGDEEIPQNDDGSYDVFAGKVYNIHITYGPAANGIEPGKYYISFLSATDVDWSQSKELILEDNSGAKTNVGKWYFQEAEDGSWWMIFDINESISKFSTVELAADVEYKFDYTDKPLEFDGDVKINVKRDEDRADTKVAKWDEETDFKAGTIEWGSEIYGHSGSKIVGQTLTDTITTTDTHHYSEADMANGIRFTAYTYNGHDSDSTGFERTGEKHTWTVTKDETDSWTSTGWAYTMPEKIICTRCGQEITLGDENWYYSFSYTSTVNPDLDDGYHEYGNKIAIDGKEATATPYSGGTSSGAGIVKTGVYNHRESSEGQDLYANDTIDWTLEITIPGSTDGQFSYYWYIYDSLRVYQGSAYTYWENPLENVTVTAKIGDGEEITVPRYGTDEARTAPICWHPTYSGNKNGVYYSQEIEFHTQCECDAANCPVWNGAECGSEKFTSKGSNFCRCWSLTEDTVITFRYSTPVNYHAVHGEVEKDFHLTEEYGGLGAILRNDVELNHSQIINETPVKFTLTDDAAITIPGVFTKKRTEAPDENNGYQAEYTITVNEAKADLSLDNQEVTITDTMTGALNFIPSTLKVTRTDSAGKVETLALETDYTYEYKPGTKGDVLEITLLKNALGPYQYELVYEALVSGSSQYTNSAAIELSRKTYEVKPYPYNTPTAVITGQTYGITLQKYDEDTDEGLNGAVFALYEAGSAVNDEGTFLKTYTADTDETLGEKGIIRIVTDTDQGGVVLKEHTLYYVQETQAPEGYTLDAARHYFWFCNDDNGYGSCDDKGNEWGDRSKYNATLAFAHKPTYINLRISNKRPGGHELPETGGSGTVPYTAGGFLSVFGAGLALLYRMKKRRRENFASS